jgi:hypothetical protein
MRRLIVYQADGFNDKLMTFYADKSQRFHRFGNYRRNVCRTLGIFPFLKDERDKKTAKVKS